MLFHHDAGGFLQITGAAVVAKPLPLLEKHRLVGVCKGGNIGKGLQETVEIGFDRFHTGLLQHDLGDPYPIRGDALSPRQVSCVGMVPLQQIMYGLTGRQG